MVKSELGPPSVEGCFNFPNHGVDAMATTPPKNLFPNSNGEATLVEKMVRGFLNLVAKGALPTIRPPPSLKPVRRPNPILDSQSREELAFGRGPSTPN